MLNRNILGGVFGNVLEWYDFAIYGYFATFIGAQFFPKEDRIVQLIAVYGIFAVGFLARPFGGIFLGMIGDRWGRKRALQVSVWLMALPTMLIGCLPGYAQLGIFAPLLLIVLRMFQGFSVGGEATTSFAFMIELAPRQQRGHYSSLALCSVNSGMIFGSLIAALTHQLFSPEFLAQWGWRLPFLFAIILAGFGIWIRQGLNESPEFEAIKTQNVLLENPLIEVLKASPGNLLRTVCITAADGAGFYLMFVWWPTYLNQLVSPPISNPWYGNTIALIFLSGTILLGGYLVDRFGTKQIIRASLVGLLFLIYPLFLMADSGQFVRALVAQLCFAAVFGIFQGAIPLFMVELFPTRSRTSGMGLGYNLGVTLMGGTAPMIATTLIKETKSIQAPAFYLIGLTLIGLISLRSFSFHRSYE